MLFLSLKHSTPMANTRILMNGQEIERTLKRLAHEILEKHPVIAECAFVGIQTRGVHLAHRLRAIIGEVEKYEVPVGELDITLYRDDLTAIGANPVVRETKIDFDLNDKKLILVDDVLFTGRTVRAALDEIMDFGRPTAIRLLVLIDRGHRELPIRADFVGKNIPTARDELVEVKVKETDGCDEVSVLER